MALPKGRSNSIVYTFGAQTPTKYLIIMVLEPFGPVVVDKLPSETEKRECRLSAGRAMNPEPQTLKAAKALKPKRQKAPQKTKKVQNKPEPVPVQVPRQSGCALVLAILAAGMLF